MARYAADTRTTPEASRREIEAALTRYGAQEIGIAYSQAQIMVGFSMRGRHIKVQIPLPSPEDRQFERTDSGKLRATEQRLPAHATEVKRLWRVALLLIKSNLELVASEAASFDAVWMAHIALPDGLTVGHHVVPTIEDTYRTGQMPESMLPALPVGKVIALPTRSGGTRA
ncbi:MAG: hypothetical protein M3457_01170 [Chloroflexota bacterium]|nr:hypothetical protein [Chloroflexota bacterium]